MFHIFLTCFGFFFFASNCKKIHTQIYNINKLSDFKIESVFNLRTLLIIKIVFFIHLYFFSIRNDASQSNCVHLQTILPMPKKKSESIIPVRRSQRVPQVLQQCHYCDEKFYLQIYLIEHINHHIFQGHKPKNAPQSNDSNGKAVKNVTKSKQPMFDCYVCHKQFMAKRNLTNHMKSHEIIRKPFECDMCGLRFAHKSEADEHQMRHWKEKNWHCSRCQRMFGLEFHLQRHERVHQWIDTQPFNEDSQGVESHLVTVIHANDIEQHTDTSNNLVEIEFDYPLPDNFFINQNQEQSNNLEPIWIASSSEEAKATKTIVESCLSQENLTYVISKCNNVDNNFKRQSLRKRNIRYKHGVKRNEQNHFNEQPIKCDPHNANNNSHEQVIQSKDRTVFNGKRQTPYRWERKKLSLTRFDCDLCGKRLPTKRSLHHHMMTHNNRKHIECTFCGKQFNRSEDKIKHERRHTRK